MKITLNLATRPYADQGPALKRLRIGMAVLMAILIALGFGLMHFHQAALRMAVQEDEVNRAIAAKQHEELGYRAQMEQPENARVLQQAQFLNALFDEKSFSWTAAMEDLERVLPVGIQVTAMEPTRAKDGRLTLHIRVSGQRERAVEMVRDMEHSRRFASPRISGENTENSQGSLQSVRDSGKVSFDVLAEYNPPTLDERRMEIASQRRTRPEAARGAAATIPEASVLRPQYIPPNAAQQQPRPGPALRPVAPGRPGGQPIMGPGGLRGPASGGFGPPPNAASPGGPQ
jgi:type IV pilus assembly protein PilN